MVGDKYVGTERDPKESRLFLLVESLKDCEPDQNNILRLIWQLCVKGIGVKSGEKRGPVTKPKYR